MTSAPRHAPSRTAAGTGGLRLRRLLGSSLAGAFVVASCALAGTAGAFGGMIAIGQSEANGKGMVDVPFSAEAELQTSEHKLNTRIRYKPGKVRDDIVLSGQKMAFIQRFDLDKSWMLMPQGMYMEFDPDELRQQGSDQVQQFELVKREVVGQETVNGEQTTKYKVVYDTSDGRYGGFTWFTEDDIAVKSLMAKQGGGEESRIRFEMTSLVRGEQDDAVFDLPADATKFDMGAMMGGMGSMGDSPTVKLPRVLGIECVGSVASDPSGELAAGQRVAAMMGGMGSMGTMGGAGGMPSGAASPSGASGSSKKKDDPNVAEQMGDAAREGAEDAAVEESKQAGREAVKRALGGLFD